MSVQRAHRQISIRSHNLVVDSDGSFVMNEEGKYLVSRISDGRLDVVEPKIIGEVFGISFSPVKENYLPSPNTAIVISSNDNVNHADLENDTELYRESDTDRSCWNRNNILQIINLYKEHGNLFKTTTIRNEKVWGVIAKEMGVYTSERCKNKFKYLKSKYVKKKDNMSIKVTGQKGINLEYFEELDEIFGNNHNISPLSIASSTEDVDQENISDGNEEIITDDRENMSKKRKENQDKENIEPKLKLTVVGQLKKIGKEIKEREKNRERQHRELLAQKEWSIFTLNNYLSYIMERDNNN
ncbi:hypothetical protein NQ314_009969 [Rhamnusium bicolor]|uniref:Myb-like domain-containing protein n=1 Tax=Rhamnusium bicolor TaxID=1586634 RepID=A0AAV8XVI5_9CUCU|nr:hypothetical protein NQ314_009969 [Rhamnusium bicolor]